jgi:SAM-dependent methyltransferase
MPQNRIEEVPSPIDLRRMADAREWESTAMAKRPWRAEFFERFHSAIESFPIPVSRILELGSGPGFLAAHLLQRMPLVAYDALDFSPAMHQLAAERLAGHASRVQFIERNFKEPEWTRGIGRYDCVVTNQAVHELRHKSYAPALHAQVREVLSPGGAYLVCDHFSGEGGMKNDQLFMSVEEQCAALLAAGFSKVEKLMLKGSLVLHHAN